MIVVAGPRIDPRVAAVAPTGWRSAATCTTSYRHLAACDLAVVQGGLTTTMELHRQRSGRSSTSRCATTSSRTSTSGTGWPSTARGAAWTTTRPTPDVLAAAIADGDRRARSATARSRHDGAAQGRGAILAELI